VEISRNVGALQLRSGGLIERPPFRALAAVDLLRSAHVLALADVEARQVAGGGETGPHHAVAVDVDAARIVTRRGNLEDLRLAALGRIGAAAHANQVAGENFRDAPN